MIEITAGGGGHYSWFVVHWSAVGRTAKARFLWLLFGLGGVESGEQVRPLAHLVSDRIDVYTF